MKTARELIKEFHANSEKIDEHKGIIIGLSDKNQEVKKELLNFSPKDLIGLECEIHLGKSQEREQPKSNYDYLLQDNKFMVSWVNGGYKKAMQGRKCKIKDLALILINPDGSILWRLFAAPANADGTYGKLTVHTNIIDNSFLED